MKTIINILVLLIVGSAWAIPPPPPVNVDGAISTHNADTTAVHGITDTSKITTNAAAITDNAVVRGDGGANGVQKSGVTIDDSDNLVVPGAITSGDPISVINTEYPVWEAVDLNGDVVASCTVECSVLTDGSQVCQIHYYVMSDTPGTLTEEFTIDVYSD